MLVKNAFNSSLLLVATLSLANASAGLAQNDMKARIKDAARLIAQNDQFKLHAQQFHADANSDIADTKKLKATAAQLAQQAAALHAGSMKMDPAKLAAAQNQFKSDIGQFRMHADAYQSHLRNFQTKIGECTSGQKEFQLNLAQYELHVDQFHFPKGTTTATIRPPHICGRMELTVGESQHMANQMMFDRLRMNQAEADLSNAEGKLQSTLAQTGGLQNKAQKEAVRETEETKIAGEFARLRDEYKTLVVEKEAIAGNTNVKLASQTVRAQIKPRSASK